MKAEIMAVGTELLIGDVINSNAAWLSRKLAELGVDVHYHVTVGDNPARIQGIVAQAVERSDLLIFTGGLGPTEDDLTMATLADMFGAALIPDAESEAAMRAFFAARGMAMPDTNLKQALKPQGAEVIRNPVGTAPGVFWDVSIATGRRTLVLCFPGVPRELFAMWPQAVDVIRRQQAAAGEHAEALFIRYLHFSGVSESCLAEMLADLFQSENPTVAPYVGKATIRIRLATKASDKASADALMAPVRDEMIRRCAEFYIGEDDDTLEQRIARLLIERGQTVSVAESCTGGLISNRLTDVPGSSAYTFINMITYGNAQKTQFLGVQPETLAAHGAVSPETATEMAHGIRAVSGCDWGLSITGIAGPDGGSDLKPVGLAYLAVSGPDGVIAVKKILANPNYSRADLKHWFSQAALYYLHQAFNGLLVSDYPR